ncbi:hypothetical protein [Hathewaya histolytica]|uniref:hypothetical protein n=1 Tax=Hathewaya histolytica TaxID=1498 RepID=UPI0010FD9FC0|nr:hypothetical protein [Hathewaya histolytica]
MFKKNPIEFLFWWEALKCKGKRNYIFKIGIIKTGVIFSIIYISSSFALRYISNRFLFKYLFIGYFIGFTLIGLISYIAFSKLWDFYNEKFLKLNLTSIAKQNNKLNIIEKIRE